MWASGAGRGYDIRLTVSMHGEASPISRSAKSGSGASLPTHRKTDCPQRNACARRYHARRWISMTRDFPTAVAGLLPRLWTFALRLSNDRRVAENLVEQACVFGLQHDHPRQSDTSVVCRMFSLIHSAWIKESGERPDSTWSASEHSESLCSGTMNPFADMPGVDASYRRIIKAVSALPDVERVVMLLVEVEGLSIDEVAGILEISRADVASRLIQARLTIGRQFTEGRSSTLIAGSTGEQA